MRGVVKWFDGARGYGFIKPDEGDGDVFVHFKAIKGQSQANRRNLAKGDCVSFEVEETAKGRAAVDVEIHDENPAEGASSIMDIG